MKRDDFYEAGYAARYNDGKRTGACPHARGSWQRGYWLKGWGAANRYIEDILGYEPRAVAPAEVNEPGAPGGL